MVNDADRIGLVFGDLTVIKRGDKNSDYKWKWICRCTCGNEKDYLFRDLQIGRATCCARCSYDRRRLPDHQARKNQILIYYKNKARVWKQEFTLDTEYFYSLIFGACSYCGTVGSNTCKGAWDVLKYNGIDRVDSSKGYVPGNVVSCCATCNRMKLDHTVADFKAQIIRIHKHFCS